MRRLLESTREYLSTVGDTSSDPAVWCENAGLDRNTWDIWVSEHGESFTGWFCRQLSLGDIERAAIDRMFWAALRRALSSVSPNAAQMNVWADIQGYKKERPERITLPVLSTEGAMDALLELPIEVLQAVLALKTVKADEVA